MHSWFLLAAAILAGDAEGSEPAKFSFDRAKAVAAGSRRGELALVTQSDTTLGLGVCETVELASPPLRVARVARQASLQGGAPDPAAVDRAARLTLSVFYTRELYRTERARALSREIVKPPTPSPTPCGEHRRPARVVLSAKSGEVLAPVAPIEVIQLQWSTRSGLRRSGFGAAAEFDLDEALALGKDGLEVRIEYLEGEPSVFRFPARQLKDLSPSWAR